MATYGLKYKADFRNYRKQDYRLYVYQRDYAGSSKTIGYLAGCALEVQGAQGRIIDPIVKTQLRFSVVDATDKADTSTVKYRNWQEFYTPDATRYKVVLYSLSGSTATAIWTGYITPDSWQESLDFRGIITITARDNIGHLKDFPFVADGIITPDENGLIAIDDIITRALEVVEFPMDIVWGTYIPFGNGVYILTNARVSAALFDGMDWYEVLEQTLEAIGYTFRYVGRNTFSVCSLRDLPKVGHYYEATGSQTMEFYGGLLELDPAVKKIEEEQDYKTEREIDLEIFAGLEYGADTTYRCVTSGNALPGGGTVSVPEHDAPANYVSLSGSTPWDRGSLLFNPDGKLPDDFLKRSEGEDGWKRYIFIPGNHAQTGTAHTYFRLISKTGAVKLTLKFSPHPLAVRMSGSMTGKMMDPNYSLSSIRYAVNFVSLGITSVRYWNGGSWVSNGGPYILTKEYDSQNTFSDIFKIELAECEDIDEGLIVLQIYDIKYKCWSAAGHGCYARLASANAELLGSAVIASNKVTTINNNDYNVMITRRPLFGALSREIGFVRPANYLAGMFYYESAGATPELFPYNANFDEDDPLVPLPVLIHQQILCYYFGAARVLSGNCAPVNKAKFDFGKLCSYKGVSYLFQGGTLDLFSGVISGAVLREYTTFNSLWSGGAPEYSEDVIYNN